jgi:hypothetical protein
MAPTEVETTQNQSTVLTPEESRELFDRKARARLGISGPEFIRRWDAGEYRNLPETPESRAIMFVAALLPFGRR